MDQDETPLEWTWLHVIEGEELVMAQAARIGELAALHQDTTKAEGLLALLEAKLRLLYEKLERAEAARRQP